MSVAVRREWGHRTRRIPIFQSNAGTVRSTAFLAIRSGLRASEMISNRGKTLCRTVSSSQLAAGAVGSDSIWEMSAHSDRTIFAAVGRETQRTSDLGKEVGPYTYISPLPTKDLDYDLQGDLIITYRISNSSIR